MRRNHDNGSSEERLTSGYDGRLFLSISSGWFVVMFGRELLPPLLPSIRAALGITSFQAGIALTGLFAMRALNQYPGGRLADQLSRKTVLVGGLAILSFGFALMSVSVMYPLFVLATLTIGAGSGAYSITSRATTSDLYVEKRGQAFGVQGAFTSLSGVASAGGAVLVLAFGSWRAIFLPIAAVLVAIALALHWGNRDPYVLRRIEFDFVRTGRRVFGTVEVQRMVAAYVLVMFAWMGIVAFLPTFLQVEKDFSPTLATASFGLVYLVGAVAGPVCGALGDRHGKLSVAGWAILAGSVGLVLVVVGDSVLALNAVLAVVSFGFWGFFPLVQAHLMDSFPDSSMGGDLGAAKTTWGFVASFGPAYVGFVADFRNYTVAYAGLVGCLAVALLILLVVSRATGPEDG